MVHGSVCVGTRRGSPCGRVERVAVEHAIGGNRVRNPDWRSRRAGPRGGAPAAGGRHVSRHRDFRRQHRDPCRPVDVPASTLPRRPASDSAGRHLPADCVRLYRRGRVVGQSSHADGGDLPHGAARRPPRIADERRGIDCGDSVLRAAASGRRRWIRAHVRRDAGYPRRHPGDGGRLSRVPPGCVRRPHCSLRPRARKSRCCRSARSCSRA